MTAVQEFEQLANTSRFQLLVYATRILRNAADAEDAVQQALAKAWRALDSHAAAGTLTAWLYIILRNECLLMLRLRRRVKRVPKEYCRAYDLDPEQAAMRNELQRVVRREIHCLPRNFRRMLLADLATITEEHNRGSALGAVTGMNVGAAKSLLSRARKGLHDRMARYSGSVLH